MPGEPFTPRPVAPRNKYRESARDWREDFAHENGNYMNTCHFCGALFTGHKRRPSCRVCANPTFVLSAAPTPPPAEAKEDGQGGDVARKAAEEIIDDVCEAIKHVTGLAMDKADRGGVYRAAAAILRPYLAARPAPQAAEVAEMVEGLKARSEQLRHAAATLANKGFGPDFTAKINDAILLENAIALLARLSTPSPIAAEIRNAALEEALDAQPSTAENPNESAYQRGRFDGIMEYAKAILALKGAPK